MTRRTGDEAAPEIATLLTTTTKVPHRRPLDDDSWLALVNRRPSGLAAFIARPVGASGIVGYAQLDREPSWWTLSYVLDPVAVDGLAIGQELCRAAVSFVSGQGGGRVQLWVRSPTAMDEEIASSVGLTPHRELCQMRRSLPIEPVPSPPLATRSFRVGQDEAAWLELNNRAFESHPEQGSWSPATLAARERQPWFDPEGFLVHERDGKMAAFCWTKVHDGDPPLGEIYVLGVDPARQGRGLGARMLATGLIALHDKGLRIAMLYVDTDNKRAVKLYTTAGFIVDHFDRVYGGEVKPAR